MFESKLNRGKAGGYAPLDGSGKVPLDKLPGSFAITGSNTFIGNQTINGSVTIDGGRLILTGSTIPVGYTGSIGDSEGMVAFDSNFLYYCVSDYSAPITGSNPIFQVTGSGTTHVYNLDEGLPWNNYHSEENARIQTGPSQEGGGTVMPEVGWYMVDDLGSIKQIISSDYGFPIGMMPAPNSAGFIFDVDSDYVYSDSNPTLTFYETIPTVNIITPAVEGTDGSGEIWKRAKLTKTPNYAPFGSASFYDVPSQEVTRLDITKDIHLIDITGNGDNSNFYLPNGLYDGQVVRFALKGDNTNGPNSVFIWMDNLRTYNGTIQSNTNWSPFFCGEGQGPCRSLATALYIDGAWNIDTDWWDM